MNWAGVAATDKEAVLAREVDFRRITPEQFAFVYEDIDSERLEPADSAVAQSLFDRSRSEIDRPPLRDTTRGLIKAVTLDVWPSVATVVDYGIDSQEHYEALYHPLRHGDFTPQQLDAALGKGPALTELVNAAPHNPHKGIVFRTSWDRLIPEPEEFSAAGQPDGRPTLSDIAERRAEPAATGAGKEKDDGFEL
jgi:hypothetical protein